MQDYGDNPVDATVISGDSAGRVKSQTFDNVTARVKILMRTKWKRARQPNPLPLNFLSVE